MSIGPFNVLLIHSDQHRFDCVGVNGHPLLRTPNLDRLARTGVNFRRAFTPNPVCSPARACLQTGTWSTVHKCVTIPGTEAFQSAIASLPVLTALLSSAGYRVGHVGKFHDEVRGTPTDHGAETFISSYAYRAWREAQKLPPAPSDEGWYGQTDPHITPEQSSLHWQADRALELLDDYGSTASRRPFFLRWDPPEPHLPNRVPEPFASMYRCDAIEPWPGFPDPLRNKPPGQRRTRQRWGTDHWTWDDWRPVVQRYLGEISLLDLQVGRLLDRLDALGLSDRTLVIYSTDHGDMCGGHGMMDKHYIMYEDIVRVPLLVRWPGVLPAGTTCDSFVEHEIDLARTILRAANIDAPDSFVGQDLVELVHDPSRGRDHAFAQYQGTHQGLLSMRMLRTGSWKYVYSPSSQDELYELTSDPGELVNRIDDPSCGTVLKDLRRRLSERMRQVRDPLSPPDFDWGRSALPSNHPAHPCRADADGHAPVDAGEGT